MNEPSVEFEVPIAGPLGAGPSPGDAQGEAGRENSSDGVEALCERVRQIALASGEDSLKAKRQQAEALVAETRAQVRAERQDNVAEVQEQLQKQVNQELQNVRLAARARIANFRWRQLAAVLDEAEREVSLMRENDPERYYDCLRRFFNTAAKQLDAMQLVVRANSKDIQSLESRLDLPDRKIQFVKDDFAAGIVVTTPDGNVTFDQSLVRRRGRQDDELRLAGAEILFPTKHGPTGAEMQHE